jgi:3-deoxy-D-manno-octulosonate 8-phosphate phosphatase KdsC-like HAD superfamily phosphatase
VGVNFINFEKIHALVVDFDGVLTNNLAHSNFNGEEFITCSRAEINHEK